MNIAGTFILLFAVVVVLTAPRKWALFSIMGAVLYLTQGQELQIMGFSVFAIRFVEIAGFIRVMFRKEFSFSSMRGIDKALILLYAYATIVFILRSTEAYAFQIGTAADALLSYFTFRGLIRDDEGFRSFLRVLIILLVPYVALVMFESLTQNNLFSSMGGIEYGDWMREGRLRCQASFRHPSLLGTLGASFLPLYLGLWQIKAHRKLGALGIVLCLLIVWASNSGGPASCVAVGITGWLLWKVRTKMKLMRRALIGGFILLALVMKAPVWYLLARISSVTGGGGYHRSYLMDVATQNLDKWWLAGMPVNMTAGWFPYSLVTTGGSDITNRFLSFGLTAGVGAIILFISLLGIAFKELGKALVATRTSDNIEVSESEKICWSLGVVLSVHIFNWLGITYFDQTYMIWFMHLAAIASISENCLQKLAFHTQGSMLTSNDWPTMGHASDR